MAGPVPNGETLKSFTLPEHENTSAQIQEPTNEQQIEESPLENGVPEYKQDDIPVEVDDGKSSENQLQFGSPPSDFMEAVLKQYRLPIEGIPSVVGEVVCRALSVEEFKTIYDQSVGPNGEVDEQLFQQNQIKQCVIWPQNFYQILRENADMLPGGLAMDITETIEQLSCYLKYPVLSASRYLTLLEMGANELNENHPSIEEVKNAISKYESKNVQVYVLMCSTTGTDYMFRGFTHAEMIEYDKEFQPEDGGFSLRNLQFLDVQSFFVKKLCLYPEDTANRIDSKHSFPVWLISQIGGHIFEISSGTTQRKQYSKG